MPKIEFAISRMKCLGVIPRMVNTLEIVNPAGFSDNEYDQRTPLHLSAAEGHLDVTEFLLNICKVNPEPKDR